MYGSKPINQAIIPTKYIINITKYSNTYSQ